MGAPSAETFRKLASETGLPSSTLETVLRLLDLLQAIAEDPVLKSRVVLKGGAALNVFHLGFDRLSVDIDLNYIGALDRDAMLADRATVEAAVSDLLASQGYMVRRLPDEHAGGKWVARHASALGGAGTIEVDLNFMARLPLFGAASKDSVPLGGVVARWVPVLDRHGVIAGKLVALLARRAARDLFDARRILEVEGLDWRLIRAGLLAWGAANRADWRKASVDAIGAERLELRQKLSICLPRGYFDAAGGIDAWIADSAARCRAGLAPLMAWTEGEREFLDRLYEAGEIDPSGLDVDEDVKVRIASMPMLKWKAQNIREHLAKGG